MAADHCAGEVPAGVVCVVAGAWVVVTGGDVTATVVVGAGEVVAVVVGISPQGCSGPQLSVPPGGGITPQGCSGPQLSVPPGGAGGGISPQ
ncbi:hypothetical protein [Nocardia pseudobrasiliensis]|uniref:hypothetical protein n=1 Tax=Nocardia pseudobrasiliensis TaxID=45979 RepID=UPI000AC5B8D2|nr:hypothetical protein [Nocardia pseudobrasiliensis]